MGLKKIKDENSYFYAVITEKQLVKDTKSLRGTVSVFERDNDYEEKIKIVKQLQDQQKNLISNLYSEKNHDFTIQDKNDLNNQIQQLTTKINSNMPRQDNSVALFPIEVRSDELSVLNEKNGYNEYLIIYEKIKTNSFFDGWEDC